MRPRPIWPTVMRLFEPKAREGTNKGATAPAAAVFKRWRREIMAVQIPRVGRGAASIRAALFVAQRVDGIQARGLASRIQAEHDAHAGAHRQRDHDDLRL